MTQQDFIKEARQFRKVAKKRLKEIEKEREKYVIKIDDRKTIYKPKFFKLDEKCCELNNVIETLEDIIK